MKRKQSIVLLILILSVIFSACGKEGVSIENGELKESTVALNKDGRVEMGIVEDFSKDYYNIDELKSFIETSVADFCKTNGENTVSLEYLKKKEDKIHATLAFDSVKSYAEYNSEEANLMKLSEAIGAGLMPDTVESADKSGPIQVSELSEKDYYVAVWKGNYRLLVDGKIAYYSNGVILNDETIQINADKETIVLFQ